MQNAGYVFSGSWTWGENISWGGTTGNPDMTLYTIARHDGLFRSAGHRTNLCNASFDEVGLGVIKGVFTQNGNSYNSVMATQNFARSSATPGPLLVGVVFADADGDNFYDPGEGISGVTLTVQNGSYDAVTSLSGGYAVPYPAGSGPINVTFSGPMLPMSITRTLTRSGENLKLDLNSSAIHMVAIVPNTLTYSTTNGFGFVASGTPNTAFSVEHSTDLEIWITVQSHTHDGSLLGLSHKPQDPTGNHFYRLTWNP